MSEYEHVPRPVPEVGRGCRIQGRPGVHLIVETKTNSHSVRVACKARWYSGLATRMVDDHFNCATCLLSIGKGGDA